MTATVLHSNAVLACSITFKSVMCTVGLVCAFPYCCSQRLMSSLFWETPCSWRCAERAWWLKALGSLIALCFLIFYEILLKWMYFQMLMSLPLWPEKHWPEGTDLMGLPSPGAEDLLGLLEFKLVDLLLKNLCAYACVSMSKYQLNQTGCGFQPCKALRDVTNHTRFTNRVVWTHNFIKDLLKSWGNQD